MEKKSIINVDGRFYYGWVMLICGFMTMFICYVIKANCTSLFYTPICEELGVTRTVYTQTNTVLTICMLIGSSFIGKIYKKYPVKYVLTGCVGLASLCYLGMSVQPLCGSSYYCPVSRALHGLAQPTFL